MDDERTKARLQSLWEGKPGLWGWLGTADHKIIGQRYLVTAFAFLIIGGIEALIIRLQLARANQNLMSPEAYDQIFTMHGVTMIFWYAQPVLSGFGNYLVPMMIGARDMAFPRLNAMSYWIYLFSGIFLYASAPLGQSPNGGWFAYVPYTQHDYSPTLGMDFYALSLIFLTISTTAGAVNFIVTILSHRAPGMTVSRMPLFLYSTATTSFILIFSLPALTVACVFLELSRRWQFCFFDPTSGGDPILWQHLFWFFGHPWVYVVFLPATGMVSMILPVFARRPIVGYTYVAAATVLTGIIGFGVWVHHMFAVGENHMAMTFFSAASMTISIFSAVQMFAWIATLWSGRPVLTTSMLFVLTFLLNFIIGGLNGIVTAVIPFDWQVHDTYFIVAHLHYVLVGANVFPVFAAVYYWYPKITGRLLDERLGRWSCALMFIGFNLAFFPMHFSGALGMPRRVYTYAVDQGWEGLNLASSIGAGVLTIGIALTLWNAFISKRRGLPAKANPWNADSLEWLTQSPPASYFSEHLPTVVTRHPLWDSHDETEDPRNDRIFDGGMHTLTTTWLDARPVAIAVMPPDTALPFFFALALTATFTALLLAAPGVAIIGVVASLALVAAWLWPKTPKTPEPPLGGDEVRHPLVTAIDQSRGTRGMALFIVTELMLFVMLFFAWFYLGPWPTEEAPKLTRPLIMLAVLTASSGTLFIGDRFTKNDRPGFGKLMIIPTLALGLVFIVLQVLEYKSNIEKFTPQMSSFASLFYTMTSFHALHLLLGLSMLVYLLLLPHPGLSGNPPHRAYSNVSWYWHFVDLIWFFIVGFVYVLPHGWWR